MIVSEWESRMEIVYSRGNSVAVEGKREERKGERNRKEEYERKLSSCRSQPLVGNASREALLRPWSRRANRRLASRIPNRRLGTTNILPALRRRRYEMNLSTRSVSRMTRMIATPQRRY